MATHASLTGANLHEPKGVASANSGEVYVADGGGSGSWSGPFVESADLNNENLIALTVDIEDVSTSGSTFVVCPLAGDIQKIYSVVDGALASADCNLSFEIAGTAVTDGGITITQSGSAAGDVDSSTPSANNTLTAGQAIEVISDGGSTNTVHACVTFLINTA